MSEQRRSPAIIILILLLVLGTISVPAFAAATGTHTPVDGVTVGVSGASDNSMSGGAVTVTAKGSGGILGFGASAKTATITITNSSNSTATLSFDWTATSVNELKIDGTKQTGTSGSFSKVLEAGSNFTVTITTAKNSTTNKLVMSNFAVAAAQTSSNITFEYDSALGSITVDSISVADGASVEVPVSGSVLVANPGSGVEFLGWIDAENKVIDRNASHTIIPPGDMTVRAVFVRNTGSVAWFMVGQYMYDNLTTAVTSGNGSTVVLMNNGTLSGSHTIPASITLLIPFDDANTLCTTQPILDGDKGTLLNASANKWVKPTAYRTLTMGSGAKIIVNGALSISGKMCAYQVSNGCPTGPLGFVSMASGSNITVNSGGNLYAWGYITGSGSVTVESGGNVYESFQLKDWRGGTVASDMIGKNQKVFIVSQYYVQNVEVPMTLKYGATEYGYTGLVASKQYADALVPFVGEKGMFNLSNQEGSVTKDYIEESDRILITIDGDITMKNLNLKVDGGLVSYDMDSSEYVLPLSNHYTIQILSGTVNISQDMCMLPGSELIIDSGAQVTLGTGVNLYVYDLDEWNGKLFVYKSCDYTPLAYVGAKKGAPVARTLTDAKIVINGIFDASKGYVYCTASGANIIGDENGRFIVGATGTSTTTYQYVQSGDGFTTVPITPARLKNANGTYLQTGGKNTEYRYDLDCNHWYEGTTHEHNNHLSTNVALGNNLDMFFAFVADGAADGWKIVINSADTRVEIPYVDWKNYASGQGYYVTFGSLAAKQMTDVVSVTLYNGTEVVDSWCDTIQDYAHRIMAKYPGNTDLENLIVDMLHYGAACQTLFGYNTGNLANAGITGLPGSNYTMPTEYTTPSNDFIDGSNVVTTSNILFAVKPKEGATISSATYKFTNHWGIEFNTDLKYNEAENYYYIDTLVVADAASQITITINGTTTYTDSMENYCARMYAATTGNDKAVFEAFMKFSSSAKIYLEGDYRVK